MGKVLIMEGTCSNPITLMGKMAGLCYGSNIQDDNKNYLRGLDCIESNHGRVLEFPTIYLSLEEYSARTIRQFYTHIAGSPSRLQSSTRYINYANFDVVTPPKIMKNKKALEIYENTMERLRKDFNDLVNCGIPIEDCSLVLPLGMTTKVCCKTNPRASISMYEQRACLRTYWEFRELMKDYKEALSNYSEEWKTLCDLTFKIKCQKANRCLEKRGCGIIFPASAEK